uniref:Uncharacterized protein n=1 Tax=viral metagenome TaxID=1070528 RepID=A0A6C0J2P1_9ZZZZ
MSCPSGFEPGLGESCHVICPDGFKYLQAAGTESCVSKDDNKYSLHLQGFPTNANPHSFLEEQSRMQADLATLMAKMQADAASKAKLVEMQADGRTIIADHEIIQSQSAAIDELNTAINNLKPIRPPTQPHEDIEIQKQKIRMIDNSDMLLVQIAIFVVFLCLVEYIVLSAPYSHYTAFLTLCIGIAAGIYLGKV